MQTENRQAVLRKIRLEMFVEGDQLTQPFDLQQFAFDHLLRQDRSGIEDAEVALLHRDLESLHVKPVARQHALRVAPLRIGRGTSAARLGFVDDVVVDQGRGVNDLHHRTQPDGALALVVEQLAGEQQQRRTKALAAAAAQVFADLGDGVDARNRVAAELALNGGQVVVQQVENFFCVAGDGCSTDSPTQLDPVIRELHVDAEILLLQQRDDFLQAYRGLCR